MIDSAKIIKEREHLRTKIASGDSPNGTITFLKLNDGNFHVLSKYEDSIWIFPQHLFPTTAKKSDREIDFQRISNVKHRAAAKLIMAKLMMGEIQSKKNTLRGATYVNYYKVLAAWLSWLTEQGVNNINKLTPMIAQQYVQYVKSLKHKRGKSSGQSIGKGTQIRRLFAVELAWSGLLGTEYEFKHPWPESSSSLLIGRRAKPREPKTAVIPDDVLAKIFQYADSKLNASSSLIKIQEQLPEIDPNIEKSVSQQRKAKLKEIKIILKKAKWEGTFGDFNNALIELRNCCCLLILITTGMRLHELANIKQGNWYSELKDGDRYYYIGSRSDKTDEGETYWLCPKLAITALKVLEKISHPYRVMLHSDLRLAENEADHVTVERLLSIKDHLLINKKYKKGESVDVLTSLMLRIHLQKVIKNSGVDSRIAPHQFRRTFANYVVHHRLGDLRYLRDHFKHWSLDMTSLYAMNKANDAELFDDIYAEFESVREGIIGHWLEPDSPITGGLAPAIKNIRQKNESIHTFSSRKQMIQLISKNIFLRSTGLAWCTNDDDSCGGGVCEDCQHSVIDDKKRIWWEAVYAQQIELRQIEDLGASGSATVERAIARCEKVLSGLGADIQKLKIKAELDGFRE